jgi:hypothetical protein
MDLALTDGPTTTQLEPCRQEEGGVQGAGQSTQPWHCHT